MVLPLLSLYSQCLKITQNVSFQVFNFGIFHQFSLLKLVRMFDRQLQVFKNETFSVIFKHRALLLIT